MVIACDQWGGVADSYDKPQKFAVLSVVIIDIERAPSATEASAEGGSGGGGFRGWDQVEGLEAQVAAVTQSAGELKARAAATVAALEERLARLQHAHDEKQGLVLVRASPAREASLVRRRGRAIGFARGIAVWVKRPPRGWIRLTMEGVWVEMRSTW